MRTQRATWRLGRHPRRVRSSQPIRIWRGHREAEVDSESPDRLAAAAKVCVADSTASGVADRGLKGWRSFSAAVRSKTGRGSKHFTQDLIKRLSATDERPPHITTAQQFADMTRRSALVATSADRLSVHSRRSWPATRPGMRSASRRRGAPENRWFSAAQPHCGLIHHYDPSCEFPRVSIRRQLTATAELTAAVRCLPLGSFTKTRFCKTHAVISSDIICLFRRVLSWNQGR